MPEGFGSPAGKRQFMRGWLDVVDGRYVVRPVGGAGSHLVGGLAHANALIVVPEDVTEVAGRQRRRGDGARAAAVVTEPGASPTSTRAGAARMVDVSGKDVTVRTATATGRVLVSAEVVGAAARRGRAEGRRARGRPDRRHPGRQADPRPGAAVPPHRDPRRRGRPAGRRRRGARSSATVRTADRTGVEMEALTCVAVAGLTLVDMVKAVDQAATITDVRVEAKSGGRSGDLVAGPAAGAVRALVVSVSNRASAGVYEDRTGPVLVDGLAALGFEVDGPLVVPDGEPVEEALREAVAAAYDVVVTSGGTGHHPDRPHPRDDPAGARPRPARASPRRCARTAPARASRPRRCPAAWPGWPGARWS